MKRKWKEWAVEHIREHNQCPGEEPAFGLPDDLVTKEDFLRGIKSAGTHRFDGCHFLEELIVPIPDNMNEISNLETVIPSGDMGVIQEDLDEVNKSHKLVHIKQKLHNYVDRIYFKEGKTLSVPEPLLDLRQYLSDNL